MPNLKFQIKSKAQILKFWILNFEIHLKFDDLVKSPNLSP